MSEVALMKSDSFTIYATFGFSRITPMQTGVSQTIDTYEEASLRVWHVLFPFSHLRVGQRTEQLVQ